MDATVAAGASRMIAQSGAWPYGRAPSAGGLLREPDDCRTWGVLGLPSGIIELECM